MGTRARRTASGLRRERIRLELGGVSAAIVSPSTLAPELRSTLRDLLGPAERPEPVDVVVDVRRRPGGYRVRAARSRAPRTPGGTPVDQVVSLLLRIGVDQEPGRLHLHAGYAAWRGHGVLVAGPDGSGKSTLVAELVRSGFDYFTDEMVGVDRALALSSFPKPVSLRTGSFATLAEVDPARTGVGSASPAGWHVPATALRPGCVATTARPAILVFARHVAGLPVASETLHPAEAARRLLADSPDAARLYAEGMRRAAELCAGLRCVQLTYGDAAAAVDGVRALVAEGMEVAQPFTALTATPTKPPHHPKARGERAGCREPEVRRESVPALAPDAFVVVVGGRCLALSGAPPALVELDETASTWLQLLDGTATLGDLVEEVAAAGGATPDTLVDPACRVIAGLVRVGLVTVAR